ncbi:MAG: glycosyl transferase family protein [Clostridia bacterium]|jgi:glycosyltransferase involved in cell wall biosynthesis|nr:glycosyl transferase family protein [Clostridia bacterium]
MKRLVIIPAYNEERNIKCVVDSIKTSGLDVDIVVVNDGSIDDTSKASKEAGVRVIDLPINLGIGGAVQAGFIYAYQMDYDVAIQVDGDGQHDVKDLSKLIKAIENQEADLIIGSRFVEKSNYKPSITRNLGINFFSKLVSLLIKYTITDTTSGYRCIGKAAISLFAEYYPMDYPEVETIVYAHKMGLKVKEISVDMNPRLSGKSSISLLDGLYYLIKVTIMLLVTPKLHKLRNSNPAAYGGKNDYL